MKHLTRVLAVATLIALAACGQAPKAEPPAPGIAGAVLLPPGLDAKLQGASLIMVDAATALAPVDVIEVVPNVYFSALTPIGADGKFEMPLPTAEELPAALLVPAADFIYPVGGVACVLTPTVPTANVMQFVVGAGLGLALPTVVVMSFAGNAPTIAAPAPVDLEAPGFTLFDLEVISWLFADAAVAVKTPVGGCEILGTPLAVDLDLKQGWNQVAMSFEVDPVTEDPTQVFLNNSSHEDLQFIVIGSF